MTAAAYATEVRRVRDAGLETVDIAAATGVDTSTVSAWLNARRTPIGERRNRLVELSAIVERLQRVTDPAYVPVWLVKPLTLLDDERPIEAIARGHTARCRDWSRNSRTIPSPELRVSGGSGSK